MPYAVTLRLDAEGAREVERLWRRLDDSGIGPSIAALGYLPHITVSRHDDLDPHATAADLAAFARGLPAIALTIDRVGIFTEPSPVIWVGPSESGELASFHERVRKLLSGIAWHPHTEAAAWVPHCTIAVGLAAAAQFARAQQAITDSFRAFACRLDRLDLVRFPPVTVIGTEPLSGLADTGRLQ